MRRPRGGEAPHISPDKQFLDYEYKNVVSKAKLPLSGKMSRVYEIGLPRFGFWSHPYLVGYRGVCAIPRGVGRSLGKVLSW